jgi:type IX secretion system PorP/SprF family membrane protein
MTTQSNIFRFFGAPFPVYDNPCEALFHSTHSFAMKQGYKPVLLLLIAFWGQLTPVTAQDPRFSQYFAAPMNLNPAMTGVFNGRWRVTANYRDQWGSVLHPNPFRTYNAGYETRINVGRYDYAAFGLNLLHDEVGAARFMQNRVHLSGAYLKKLADGGRKGADHYLSVGGQIGGGQNSIDWSRLWFSRQFDIGTERPDFGAPSGETGTGGRTNLFADFNAGLVWYMIFGDNGFVYAGGAMNHINEPVISLFDNEEERLYRRYSGHMGGQFPVTENFSLLPGAQVMLQGPSFETDAGLNLRYSNNDRNELALRFGVWGRIDNKLDKGVLMDAVTVVGMLELNRWILGLSYDITVSSLSLANNSRGAVELSLSYVHPERRRSKVKCPKF